jgi:hypothetical protein
MNACCFWNWFEWPEKLLSMTNYPGWCFLKKSHICETEITQLLVCSLWHYIYSASLKGSFLKKKKMCTHTHTHMYNTYPHSHICAHAHTQRSDGHRACVEGGECLWITCWQCPATLPLRHAGTCQTVAKASAWLTCMTSHCKFGHMTR